MRGANKYSKYEAWFTQSPNDTSAIIHIINYAKYVFHTRKI